MSSWDFLKNGRSLSAVLHDLIAFVLAWFLAYWFRFNFAIPPSFFDGLWLNLAWALPIQTGFFFFFGLYQGVWRFASTPDLKRILKAVVLGALVIAVTYLMVKPFGVVPRSVFILTPILLLMLMGGSRFAYRAWKEYRQYGMVNHHGKPVFVLGAGDAAMNLVKELSRSRAWKVVGLLDDDVSIMGRQILDVQVIGKISDLPQLASKKQVEDVIIAMPSAAYHQRRRALEIANESKMTVLTVPAFDDLMSGRVNVSQIHKVEVEDLLGRETVRLDNRGLLSLIEANTVLVSGAGGSIGAELCRQVLKYQPSRLVCLDISEFALYRIEQELSQLIENNETELVFITADVKNNSRIESVLNKYRPSMVYHAAAYKHVPLMEHENVAEALANNVTGTYTIANACKKAGVEKFVLISTDKAVNPTNIMGASKRLAEMVCQGLQNGSETQFVVVRFGNVLGSSGSVIPKFRDQIATGGPITVTHPEITRYFMSIPEAAQLVMQAALMGDGGEIFVLDMGESVKIVNLAQDMIRLSGLHQDEIEIVFTGLRPGEKLYEELLADDEHTLPTTHDKLRIAEARTADQAWVKRLLKWVEKTQSIEEETIKQELKMWVNEYQNENYCKDAIEPVPQTTTIH